MKRLNHIGWRIFIFSILFFTLPQQKVQAQGTVSFQIFYNELAPYGQWIEDPQYGFVWAPGIRDFRPYYTNGRWAMTEYGNTWVSDYSWGWAPFHYGRWTYDSYYGWVWIPGNEWGPAWVSWRSGGGYYGWAPLGPGVHFSVGNYYAPNDWWTFIPYQYIYSSKYNTYWHGSSYNKTIIHNTTIINNYYNNQYVSGPRRADIAQHTGGKVNIYNIRNDQNPRKTSISGNAIQIYRPAISKSNGTNSGEAPKQILRAQRPIENPQNRANNNPRRQTPPGTIARPGRANGSQDQKAIQNRERANSAAGSNRQSMEINREQRSQDRIRQDNQHNTNTGKRAVPSQPPVQREWRRPEPKQQLERPSPGVQRQPVQPATRPEKIQRQAPSPAESGSEKIKR